VIITRLLAVLVVALVVTSVLGFTLFDRQEGTSATALVSLAIGGVAAVLGLIFGFREATKRMHSGRRSTKLSCPLSFGTRCPLF
jgi:fumarate reductase subunit D